MSLPPKLPPEELIEHLAEAEIDNATPPDPTVQSLQQELNELQQQVRQPEPPEPYAHEPEGLQVVEAIAALSNVRDRAEPAPSSTSVDPPAETLGQYELLKLLGQGGMGAVYKARHARLDKIVALKVLPAGKLKDPQAVSRFEREMRAVGKLQHPHIVAAHDAGEIDGTHYLVMELVDGIDLGALVKQRGPLAVADACELIRQAALGLQHAHEHGLVHRDIKPSNLMLTRPQRDQPPTVKILDMGLALLEDAHTEGGEELTSTGQVMGTIDYMAPEQSTDTHTVDIRADIYSLGASLFKLLTGRAPFAGERSESVVKKLMALATQPAPELRSLRPDCPPQLSELVKRLLSKSPEDRPTPPAALAELLAPFAQGADLAALVTGGESGSSAGTSFSFTRTAGTVEPDTPTLIADADGKGDSPPWSRRKVVLGFAGAAAVLLGVIIITITKRDGTSLTLEVPEDATKVTITTPLGSTPEISIIPEASASGVNQPFDHAGLAPAATFDHDREVAQKLMSIGGKALVFFRDAAGGQGELHPAEPLPDRPYEIYQLGIPASSEAAELLRGAAGLKGLRTVAFHTTVGGSDVFTALAHLGRVRHIEFPNDRTVTANQLKQLAQLPRLGWLALHHDAVPRSPDVLQEFRNVQVVKITNGNDEDLRLLAPLPNLRTIEIFEGTVTASSVAQLQAQNPHVRVILRTNEKSSLIGSDPSLIAMQQLIEKGLRFEGSSWPLYSTPKHFFALQELNGASPLCVNYAIVPPSIDMQDQDLALVSDIQVFIGWDLRGASSVTPFLRCLTSSAVTEWISLDTCRLSTADLQQLSAMPWLTWMRIMGTGVSREQVDSLRKSLPYTKIYSDFGDFEPLADTASGVNQPSGDPTPIVAPTASPIDYAAERAAAEWTITKGGRIQIAVSGKTLPNWMTKTSELPGVDFQVRGITFIATSLTDADQDRLARLTSLETLALGETNFNAQGIRKIANIRSLELFGGTRLPSSALAGLRDLPRLTRVILDGPMIDDQLAALKQLKALREIDLLHGQPAHALAAAKLPQLRILWLKDRADFDPQMVQTCQETNPFLRIIVGDKNHRILGRDPEQDLARRLESLGAQVTVLSFPPGSSLLASTADLHPERTPFQISGVILPTRADLEETDRIQLGSCTRLTTFNAIGARNADQLATALAGQSLLQYCNLRQSDLSDEGLRVLQQLPSLISVTIRGTRVTHAAIETFRRARRKCKVQSDFGDFEPLRDEPPAAEVGREYSSNWQPLPEQQAFFDEVAQLPLDEQAKAVKRKLQEVNVGDEGKATHRFDATQGLIFNLSSVDISDLWPVRALPGLSTLICNGTQEQRAKLQNLAPLTGMKLTDLSIANTQVSDLSPLAGMPLQHLEFFTSPVTDLSPLRGMPLSYLNLANTSVSDLTPLQGAPITYLSCSNSRVDDLTPLAGMPLTTFHCRVTRVTDLSPLKEAPLKTLTCDDALIAKHRDLLRGISTLETINGRPASEILSETARPELIEPAPLEEWLKGREILTVRQDGTAMFTTIQAAFSALRAGGVIEILDDGPYVESLNITLPKDSGFISRCRSRIVISGWTRSSRSDWQGPYEAADGWILTAADGFRLHGVDVFLDSPQAPPESVLRGAIKFLEASGVLVENCSFYSTRATKEAHYDHVGMGILGRASEQLPSCLRDSLFLGCQFYASGVGPLLVQRNFIDDVANDGIKAMSTRQQLLVRNNIINCQGGEGIRVLPSLNLNIEIASNTLPQGRIAIPAFTQEHTLSCHHNVMGAMQIPSNGAKTAEADIETMRSRYNVADAVHDNMIFLDSVVADVRGVNVIACDPSLSTDPAARDAFRVTTADAVNVGALPPGPAPAQGDWFTRLQERFREIAASPKER